MTDVEPDPVPGPGPESGTGVEPALTPRDIERDHYLRLAGTGGIIVAGAVAYAVTPLVGERAWLGAILAFVSVAVIVPLTASRVRAVSTSDRPLFEAIQALVLLLTLLVFGFAGVFVVLNEHGAQFVGLHTKIDAVYFTVITLSTVGYGDVHASGQTARLAVSLQIVFNLVFLAVAVRLLTEAAKHRFVERASSVVPNQSREPG